MKAGLGVGLAGDVWAAVRCSLFSTFFCAGFVLANGTLCGETAERVRVVEN